MKRPAKLRLFTPLRLILMMLTLALALHSSISAQSYSDSLSSDAHAHLDSICAHFQITPCCSTTIKSCIEQRPGCSLAPRIKNFAAWMLLRGSDDATAIDEMQLRTTSLTPAQTLLIDTTMLPWAGNPAAPVTLVVYVSASCGLCKRVVAALYDSVTTGSLKNRAKLMAKPFGTGVGDLALFAAAKENHFWDYFIAVSRVTNRIDRDTVIAIAKRTGISTTPFIKLLDDPKLHYALQASKAEGTRNTVTVTPTIFINNQRYRSFKDPQWVVDGVMGVYEQRYKKK